MNSKAFEQLCRSVFEESDLDFAPDAINRHGQMKSVWLVAGQSSASLMHVEPDADKVHVVVSIGKPDPEEELSMMEDYMSANLELISSENAVRFSRHPLSGELMMQCIHALDGLTAKKVLEVIAAMTAFPSMNATVQAWMRGSTATEACAIA